MSDRLFEYSWAAVWDAQVRKAVGEVDQLSRDQFSDPSLAGALQKIVEKHSVDVARLTTDPSVIVADPFEEERSVDDYGFQRTLRIKRLRVSIPFTGEAETLKFHPSRWSTPGYETEIGEHSVSFIIPDDANADREVQSFCQTVQSNLDLLRQEYERDKPRLAEAVSQAAEKRKKLIADENALDASRAFTVRRR